LSVIRTELTRILKRAGAVLPDGPTLLRLGATGLAGVIAAWAIGLAFALVAAVLAGAVALAAAIAVVLLGGSVFARRRPALVKAAARDILRARQAGRSG
jgi:dihydrodipicolinate synthase/N-acetylneuraminate lyase